MHCVLIFNSKCPRKHCVRPPEKTVVTLHPNTSDSHSSSWEISDLKKTLIFESVPTISQRPNLSDVEHSSFLRFAWASILLQEGNEPCTKCHCSKGAYHRCTVLLSNHRVREMVLMSVLKYGQFMFSLKENISTNHVRIWLALKVEQPEMPLTQE